ncbi:MAG: glycosyltransferase family 39 protein [Candidatus Obscuribacter sp.]|nr:glycosyltransferase family 39 protein [Candidatus Obscuribacter sp.]
MATSKRTSRRFDHLLVWPLCLVTLVGLVYLYFQNISIGTVAPFSLGEEGAALFAADYLSSGKNPYDLAFLNEHPWRVVGNPPFYYWLASWFFKVTGPVLLPLRSISTFSFVILLMVSYRIFALSGASKVARVIGLITLSAFWSIWAFASRGTPDMLSLMFVALTIEQYMVLARKPKDDNIFRFPRLVVIATLAVLATLTKQTGAAVVPAIAFALIVGRQWRLSLVFMGLYSVLISGVLLFVNNLTHGGLAAHLAFAMSSPLSLSTLREHLTWLGSDWLLIAASPVCAVNLIVGYFERREEREGPYRHYLSALVVMTVLFWVSAFASLIILGTLASSVTDVYPVFFAVAWLVAMAVDYLERRYIPVLFIAFGAGLYVMHSLYQTEALQVASMLKAEELIAATSFDKKLMLSEECSLPMQLDVTPEFVDINTLMSGWSKHPEVLDSHLTEIKNRIRNKEYGSIVINSLDGVLHKPYKYWDDSVIMLIKKNYRPQVEVAVDGRIQDFYLPRK